MKMIRKLLTTFLVLLSITVAFASVASDISVTSTNNNGAIAHGQTDSRTLTFTNSNSTDSFNLEATSPNSTIQISSSNQILVSNLSSNTLSYTVSVPEHTAPGNYSYDIEYNGSSETFYYTVPSADTKTIQFADSTITVENGTNAQFTLNLNNTGNLDYIFGNELLEVLKLNKNNQVNLTGSDQFLFTTFNAGEEQNGSITFMTNSSSEFGIYTGNYIYSLGGVNTSLPITVSVLPESHNTRLELEFDLDDITNDDSDTYPGDYMRISDISITNEYTNNDEDSIEDIELEYNVYLVSDGDDIIEEEYSQTFDLEEDQDVDEFDIQFQVPYDAVAGTYIVELIITGDGEIKRADNLVKELGITDSVRVLGWVSIERLNELYRDSSIYVLPSRNEGLPMGILEAMNNSLAVISSPVGGIPELISDGENGLLVEPGNLNQIRDNLDFLIREEETRFNIANLGRESVESMGIFNYMQTMSSEWSRVVGSRRN